MNDYDWTANEWYKIEQRRQSKYIYNRVVLSAYRRCKRAEVRRIIAEVFIPYRHTG